MGSVNSILPIFRVFWEVSQGICWKSGLNMKLFLTKRGERPVRQYFWEKIELVICCKIFATLQQIEKIGYKRLRNKCLDVLLFCCKSVAKVVAVFLSFATRPKTTPCCTLLKNCNRGQTKIATKVQHSQVTIYQHVTRICCRVAILQSFFQKLVGLYVFRRSFALPVLTNLNNRR